jgi:hypothetical protein
MLMTVALQRLGEGHFSALQGLQFYSEMCFMQLGRTSMTLGDLLPGEVRRYGCHRRIHLNSTETEMVETD